MNVGYFAIQSKIYMTQLPYETRQDIYNAYQELLRITPSAIALRCVAEQYNLKTHDIKKCIKEGERNRNKLVKKAKDFTGKITSKDCDTLWLEVVKVRASYKCERENCHHKVIQAHHIYRKGTFWALRFDLENGIALCEGHHIYFPNAAHRDENGFAQWIKTKRDMDYLESKKHNRSRHDYSAIYLYLKQELAKYKK